MRNKRQLAKIVTRMLLFIFSASIIHAQITTTTVQGVVYRADGTPAAGTLIVTWPALSTANSQAIAAGSATVSIGQDGFVSLNLAPNAGASPAGSYYTAIYHLNDGTVNKEYWVVPAGASASIASVRAQLIPATVAVQDATKQYVDASIASLSGNYLPITGGTLSGPLVLSSTANLTIGGEARVGAALTAASLNGEITVDGNTYTTLNAAWNAAASLVISSGHNQTVRLGPGTYSLTATLMEPGNGACVNLVGSGGASTAADSSASASTLSVPSDLSGDVIFLGNSAQAQGCLFKDFTILGNANATHGLELQWFRGLVVDNVAVNDTSAEGILLGEESTSNGHQSGFLLRNVTVSYNSASFTPASRPAYGIHLLKTAIDSQLDTMLVRNAQIAAVYNEGTGNTGYMIHGFGYPYTCTTAPCSNTASSSTAADASYATNYVVYDTGGAGSVWTDTYADSPAIAAFYIGASGTSIHGGHIQWPDLTSFPSANLAYVASSVTNGLEIADIGCLGMSPSVNWITYASASGVPPTFASVHHLTGCGNYAQALEPETTTGFTGGGASNNAPGNGVVATVWASPKAGTSNYEAYSAQLYNGYQTDLFEGHVAGQNPFFNVTYQGTVRSQGVLRSRPLLTRLQR
ncbi:hypothetical protein [Alloacidobacterium sp.]|uniref:hypothetical protein n=1 Tax=Alloacidobacterium sp. TaxID=2951999 RepID=UPI002D3A4992|nr:hypothetical protein [Alloacidobacterium sp.]HYK35818.1 hypothetical protein [Alloacidobacterium sp.]